MPAPPPSLPTDQSSLTEEERIARDREKLAQEQADYDRQKRQQSRSGAVTDLGRGYGINDRIAEEYARIERENRRNRAASNPYLDERRKQLEDLRREAAAREAPMMSAAELANAERIRAEQADESRILGRSQFLGDQEALIRMLQGDANGTGPSVAQNLLRTGLDQNVRGLQSAIASGRGAGGAANMRLLAGQSGQLGQQAAGQMSALRAQEMLNARGLLGQQIGQGLGYDTQYRGQDIGLQMGQAGLRQQANLANQAAGNQFALTRAGFQQEANRANQASQLQNQAQVDAMTQFFISQGMSAEEAERQARLAAEGMNLQDYSGVANRWMQRDLASIAADAERRSQDIDLGLRAWGTLAEAAGAGGAAGAVG